MTLDWSVSIDQSRRGTERFHSREFSRPTWLSTETCASLDAGAKITSGQRIILVGFVETVDVLKNKQRWEKQSIRQRQERRIPNE